ncbi:MAG: hypothetical protein AAF799_13710 [Myxococcota bacterium]
MTQEPDDVCRVHTWAVLPPGETARTLIPGSPPRPGGRNDPRHTLATYPPGEDI